MSTTIDQKVVEMRFDNQQFEKGIATSMNSIEKLEKSLDLKGATKGLENVESAARNCNMSGLSSAVDTVKMKFSALEVMGITALSNITNSAVNAGKRIVSALTIDPVKSGFSEYELKMGSIQTMMAATGESLETVNGYLNELNEYSDKTIYSFSDMTQNIGKFTNAGVNLEDSVAAIKGIANVAAVSGANSNEASRAMYNFAQALSSGYVKLIDWKSIELANMGTVEFKEQLLDAAVAAKTLTKTGDGMYKTMDGKVVSATKNFNDSLQDQWMTSEVLISTLKKYTDTSTEIGKKATQAATEVKTLSQLYDTLKESAQSGWAQTWEIIVGDFEEAKQFMTELSEIFGTLIGKQAESRNELFENWKVLGGRTALLDSIRNVFEGIGSIVKPISEAFKEIFPPMTAERLLGFTEGLRNLTARLKISDDTSDKLKRTFKGLFAVLDIARMAFVAIFNVVGKLLSPTGKLGNGILSLTAGLGDLLVAIRDFIARSDVLNGVFSLLGSIIGWVVNMVGDAASFIGDAFSSGPISSIVTFLNNLRINVAETFDAMGSSIEGSTFFTVLAAIGNVIKTIAKTVINVLGKAFEKAFGSFEEGGFMNFLDALISGGIGIGIIKLIMSIVDVFKSMSGIAEQISEMIGGVTDTFKAFQNTLNASALSTIAKAILILVISLFALTLIDKEKLSDALATLTVLFAELMIGMTILNGFKAKGVATSMLGMATALLLMIIPLKILSGMDSDSMTRGLTGLTLLLTVFAGTLVVLSKIKTNGVLRHIGLLRSIAIALLLMTIPLAIIGNMEWDEIKRGLGGMAGVLAVVMVTLAILSKIKTNGVLRHIGLLRLIAIALLLMSAPLAIIGNMEWDEIKRGLGGMAGMLAMLTVATFVLSKMNTNGALKNIWSIEALAVALIIMAIPLETVGTMEWGVITKGLKGLGMMLGGMTAALMLLSLVSKQATKSLGQIGSIIALALALILLTHPLKTIGEMDWDSMWRGLAGLGIILGGLLVAMLAMAAISYAFGGGAIALGAAGMIGMAVAIWALVPALVALSLIPIYNLVKAILAIAAAFVVLGVGGMLLGSVSGTIMSIGVAMLMIGAGLLAAGVGVTAFAVGLGILAVTIETLGTACVALVGMMGTIGAVLTKLIASVITGLIIGLGEGIIAILGIIKDAIPAIAEIVKTLILEFCNIILECAPKIVDTVLELLALILESLVTYLPRIVQSLGEVILLLLDGLIDLTGPLIDRIVMLLVTVLEGIANSIEPLIAAALNVLTALLNGMVKGIANLETDALLQALKHVGILAAIIAALAVISMLAPAAMAGAIYMGLIVTELSLILAALGALSQIEGLTWLVDEGGNLLQAVGTAIGKFIGGLGEGMSSSLPTIADNLSQFMTNLDGFITGAKSIDEAALNGIKNLAAIMVLIAGAEIIDGIASFFAGGSSMGQFATEIMLLGAGLLGFSKIVEGVNVDAVGNATSALISLAGLYDYLPNIGGIVALFTGEQSMALFAAELPLLGVGLLGFSKAVENISIEAVTAGTNAAIGLAGLYDYLPHIGGIAALFTGEQSMALFAAELPLLGAGLLGFSMAVDGINVEAVTAGTNAAIGLAGMYDVLPNIGGIAALFTGEQSMGLFAMELPLLGAGLLGFSKAVEGISVESVTAATNAAIGLAGMYDYLPKVGGITAWFEGENSMSLFALELPLLGAGLKGFADAVNGITPESVTAAADAAIYLAQVADALPTTGGVFGWLNGETDWEGFKTNIPKVGEAMKGFSDAVAGITPANITAAAEAAISLASVANALPTTGGLFDWATADTDWEGFKTNIPKVGEAIKGFADAVGDITPENVTAGANAAKSLGEMADTIPKDTDKIVKFGDNLIKFGDKLKTYFTNTSGITDSVATATNNIVDSVNKVAGINSSGVKSAADAVEKLGKAINSKNISGVTSASTSGFVSAVKNLASTSLDSFTKTFEDITKKMSEIGKKAIDAFVKGVSDNTKSAKTAGTNLAEAVADAAGDATSSFSSAGKDVVTGFANGISTNTYLAEAKARAMAAAAAKAAKEELDINSPSKVFRSIGTSVPEGFAQGVGRLGDVVASSVEGMSTTAVDGLKNSLSRIASMVNADMDAEPTIRPVIDLSQVETGMRTLGRMMNVGSNMAVLANVGAISSGMAARSQNGDGGTTTNSNVTNNTYIIDGVTYDDGSNVANAMEEIVHAAKVERRT